MALPPEPEPEPVPVIDTSTESGKVEAGTHRFCKCGNLVTGDDLFCPYCKHFNPFGNVLICPTCMSKLLGA